MPDVDDSRCLNPTAEPDVRRRLPPLRPARDVPRSRCTRRHPALLVQARAAVRRERRRAGDRRARAGDARRERERAAVHRRLRRHPAVRDAARLRLRDAAGRDARDDGFGSIGCRITNAVKCLPPDNKPTPEEVRTCNSYLAADLRTCPTGGAILALGRIAHDATLRGAWRNRRSALRRSRTARGMRCRATDALFDSYHCSRYNTNTAADAGDVPRGLRRDRASLCSRRCGQRHGQGPSALSQVTSRRDRACAAADFDARELLKSLPHRPGVYRMFDAAGETLYVGKARDLKKRVANYFQKAAHETADRRDGRAGRARRNHRHALRRRGAAAREQLHQGARAALQHPVPRRQELSVRLHHRRSRFRSCASIAARSTAATAISARSRARARCATASRTLQKVFQLRTCENTVFANRSRPCMLYQIQRCTAPCVGFISEAEYREDVEGAALFLQRQGDEVLDAAAGADGSRRGRARVRARGAHSRQDHAVCRRCSRGSSSKARRPATSTWSPRRSERGLFAVNVVMIRGGRHVGDRTFFPRHADAGALDGGSEVVPAFLDAALRRASGAADDRRPPMPTITRRWRRCCPRRRDSRSRSSAIPAASGACGSRWRMQNADVRDPAEARAKGHAGGPARRVAGGARACRRRSAAHRMLRRLAHDGRARRSRLA